MAEIINLNRFRKERERAQKRAEADQNAAKHGRSRVEKLLETLRAEKAARSLDAHIRDRTDAPLVAPVTLPTPPQASEPPSDPAPPAAPRPRPTRKPKA